MSEQSVSLSITIPKDSVEGVSQAVLATGGKVSKPIPANSASEALNAPITGAEMLLAAQVVTCIFTSIAAAAQFLVSLKGMKKDNDTPMVVINLKTQEKIEVTADMDEERVLNPAEE